MLTPEQLKERRNYIGASEAAAVMGLSRWATPLSVWAEKTGQIVREDDGALHKRLGHKMEAVVADLFTEETGEPLELIPETLYHPVHPFIACNLDRRIVGKNDIVQLKTAASWKGKEWDGDEIPTEYLIQEIHELAVTGADRAHIAVVIGNQDFKIKTIERTAVMDSIKDIVSKEVRFWNDFVVPKVMPTIITPRDRDTLEALFPEGIPGDPVELTDQANILAESIEALKADRRLTEDKIARAENEILAMLGKNELGTTGLWKFQWVNTGERRFKTKLFKKENPDLYEKYREKSAKRRFLITAIKEEENGDNANSRKGNS